MRLILVLSVLVSLAQSYKSYDGYQVKNSPGKVEPANR